MSKITLDYLRELQAHFGGVTVYGVFKNTGIPDQTVRQWEKGTTMSEDHCKLVADILGYKRGEVLANVAAERSKDPEIAAIWAKLAQAAHSMKDVAAGIALFVVVPFLAFTMGGDLLSGSAVVDTFNMASNQAQNALPFLFSSELYLLC